MTRPDAPQDVEFMVDDAESGPDEVLDARPGGLSRRAVAALVLVVALLAVAVVVRVVTSHDAAPTAVPTTARTTSAPTPIPTVASTPVPSGAIQLDQVEDPSNCPRAEDGQAVCTTTSKVPVSVLAAIRERYAYARFRFRLEEQLRDVGYGPGGLWFRQIRAEAGDRRILVEVRKQRVGDEGDIQRSDDGTDRTIDIRRVVRGYFVRVRVTGPLTDPPAQGPVDQLSGDPRLRANV